MSQNAFSKIRQDNQIQPANPKSRFHLKTWQWLSVLILAAVIAGVVFVFWNRGTQVLPPDQNDIKQAIKEANYCNTADDCVLLGAYCPFSGSWETYVNKQEKENIR
ncbi:MAG: hypothetical protein ABH896_02020, partial [Candidatus Jacksonbacteria bacterium]